MKRDKLLRIYLQDHDALALITARLIRRGLNSNEDSRLGDALSHLGTRTDDDRRALAAVMSRLGIRPHPLKRGSAWLAERGGVLKLNGRLFRYSPLSRVFELEGLTVLLTMRIARWQVLRGIATQDERLRGFDFDAHIAHARADLVTVTDHHEKAAAEAF